MSRNTKIIVGWIVTVIVAFVGGGKTFNNQSVSVYIDGQLATLNTDEVQSAYNDLASKYNQASEHIEELESQNAILESQEESQVESQVDLSSVEEENANTVKLSNRDIYGTYGQVKLKTVTDYTDIYKRTYEGISFYGKPSTLMDPFTYGNSYFLNKEFVKLTFMITIYETYSSGEISFYSYKNDTNTELGTYTFSAADDEPYEITVDLTDVTILNICMTGIVMADAILYRS